PALFLPSVRWRTRVSILSFLLDTPVTDNFTLLLCLSALIVPRICHSSAFYHCSDHLQAPQPLYYIDGQTIRRNNRILRYPS
ncbi:hypothetical protein EDB19DRAFT_1782971, partial [Suillus lakei]